MPAGLRPRLALLAILPAIAGVLLVAMASTAVLHDLRTERTTGMARFSLERAEQAVAERFTGLHAVGIGAAQRPDIGAALAAGDAAALRAPLVTLFEALRAADPTITVLEVTDAQGRVAVRGHDPSVFGDDKSGLPDVARALRGETASGVAFSPTSRRFAFSAVLPVRQGGQVVGTLRIGSRLDGTTARDLATVTGAHVLLLDRNGLIASSVEGLGGAVLPPGLTEARQPVAFDLTAGMHVLGLAHPLRDAAGAPVGAIAIAYDMTPWLAAERQKLLLIGGLALLVLLCAGAAGLVAAGRVARPLAGLGDAMKAIADGRLDTPIVARDRPDEIGAMARALEVFRDETAARARLEAEAAEDRAEQERRAKAMDRHTQEFGAALSGVMRSLGGAAENMGRCATSMAASATQTEARATETAESAEGSVGDLGSVAAATEELTASVGEIARQAATAATAARSVADHAQQADGTMQRLAEAAATIGDVARLIGDIAGQTNLLALNATIEAARAGEAGKGFAVVAGEVKALAAQTAKATEEIATQIQAIRGVTEEAVGVVRDMAGQVQDMGETSAAIAAAVEQQGAATREIAANVTRVLDSSRRAVTAMGEARRAAGDALAVSRQVEAGAGEVERESSTLQREVDQFLASLRSARGDRRHYDRVAGDGRMVELAGRGGLSMRGRLRDMSRGGMAVEAEGTPPAELSPGRELQVSLPGAGAITARVSRVEWPTLALVLSLDDDTTARLDGVIASLLRRAAA
ncbi:methyl-accepting chemotaxis protein [Falsiroseomonas bella]|uniref:methyl-accepting chemotaxis protein n=1 Tax=Falsiroseomonas bella TaxID=2184016 RepID=UPI001E3134BE|nr:methyl-accepting chemotaxis protein [Falsiroseomonas bella]